VPRHWSEARDTANRCPAVKVARVRPALVFSEDQANQLLREAEDQDVTASGTG
jgi:hypothetical protein